MDQLQIKNELILRCDAYYSSIEAFYIYRKDHITRYNQVNVFYFLSAIVYTFLLFPIQGPIDITRFLYSLIGKEVILFGFELDLTDFYTRWAVQIVFYLPFFLVVFFVRKKIRKQFKKRSIAQDQLAFAYLANAIKDLQTFLINDRDDLIKITENNLQKYFAVSDAYFISRDKLEESSELYLPNALKQIRSEVFWVNYDKSTNEVLNALGYFEEKVLKRIKQKIEIDQVIDWLNNLLIYEFSKIKKTISDDKFTNTNLKELGQIFFMNFCECLNIAQVINTEILQDNAISKINLFKRIGNFMYGLSSLFTHQLILVCFVSWFFLMGAAFVVFTYVGTLIFKLTIDNTVLITIISGVIVGATTITATIYSKRKD